MTVAQTRVLDVVAQDQYGRCLLVMIEDRRWGSEPAQESQLREKVNSYFDFIVGGSLLQIYPAFEGASILIRLDCIEEPRGDWLALIEFTKEQLAWYGIEFSVKCLPDSAP